MYLMSASLMMGEAVIPVSSYTSRRAASNAFSPGSTRPLGRQRVALAFGRTARFFAGLGEDGSLPLGSSMAAIHQLPSFLQTTTPPAEISRIILSAT